MTIRTVGFAFALAAVAGCSRGEGGVDANVAMQALPAVFADTTCVSPQTDSARAVCTAIRYVSQVPPHPRAFKVYRENGDYCVILHPWPPVLDGEIGVRVDLNREAIAGLVRSDSVYCPAVGEFS